MCKENGGKSSFGANEVKDEYKASFKKAIKDQVKLDDTSIDLSTMRFVQSSLSLDDHITHLKGKLCDFLSKKFGDSSNLSINVLVSLLEQECRHKSKVKSADIIDFSDLISRKGLSSQGFNSVLDSLNASNSMRPNWGMAEKVFSTAGKTPFQLIPLNATFSQVCIDLNQNKKNPSTVYLEYAVSLYDEAKTHSSLKLYLTEIMQKIDVLCPDYALALTAGKKECIVVYLIIKKLLEADKI
ncbi:dsDNA nuclease domain-containing protein [Psychromonas ossibalaenae]|uniref:dsDNA nuclease domain-containing protein n=1 Tax=Psychromonas ossibalaenae TaxID=444922 RepID=UPI00037FE645